MLGSAQCRPESIHGVLPGGACRHMIWYSNFGKGTNFFCSDKSRRGVGGGRELTHFNVKNFYKWGKKWVERVKYI